MKEVLPILSLVVAAFAIFIGPLISSRTVKQTMLGTMREKWMAEFRSLLSGITSECLHYYQSGFEELKNDDYLGLTAMEHQILFMIIPDREDHQTLVKNIRHMISSLEKGREADEQFIAAYEKVIETGRLILLREWNVVKKC